MTNPFEELRKERLAEDEAKRLAEAELKQRNQNLHDQYNEMVQRVLNQLQVAVYPECKVRDHHDIPSWGLGHEHITYGSGEGQTVNVYWNEIIVVEIEFSNHFICKMDKLIESCPLSEPDLIKTLLLLHKKAKGQ